MQKSKIEYYKTVLTIAVGCMLMFFSFKSPYFLYFAVTVGTLALLSDTMANSIHALWMALAKLLSYMIPNIVMSILFFLILTPIALLQRLFSKNRTLQLNKPKSTTFSLINKTFNKTLFEKPW